MRDIGLAFTILAFLGLGLVSPFVLTLGYVWTDTFYPQWLSFSIFQGAPISALMGIAAIGGYFLLDRRSPPRPTLTFVFIVAFAGWITATCSWAAAPDLAWIKWNWAFKTVLFSAFVPFAIRSRVQIEALLQVYLFSAAGHLLPWGIKTMVDGGGYNRPLGLLGVNAGAFGESSMVAATIIMLIPLVLVLRQHSMLIESKKLRDVIYIGFIVIGAFGAIGTYARTAIIGACVLAAGLLLHSRRKMVFLILMVPIVLALSVFLTTRWTARISTIENPTADTSADTRLIIWQWTRDYADSHPLGGGFYVHSTSEIAVPIPGEEQPMIEHGRAPHSVYFEVLGEHGWIGLGLFLGVPLSSLLMLMRTSRRCRRHAELAWCRDLAKALQISIVTILACGAFIGISYQPTLWDLFALSICASEYSRRYLAQEAEQKRAVLPRRTAIRPAVVQSPRGQLRPPYNGRPAAQKI
jgi:probable O-glycosylation ligase (exosortase A-associated)